MAEESEKNPKFVLRKKEKKPEGAVENVSAEATQPAKKKIVIKKKPMATGASGDAKSDAGSEDKAKNGVHVVVKKPTPAPSAAQKTSEQQEKPRNDSGHPVKSFELNSARPNVKAGNLSGGRQGNNYRGGYNNGGYNNGQNRGYGQNGGRSGGFTGTQAREGYQNRERDNNRQGGFNRGMNGGQGGFGGQRQGGFNRGGFNNGQGGQGRPGFGSRPGFGGQG